MKHGLRLVVVASVLALVRGAASADNACAANAGLLSCADNPEQVFAPWGDNALYTLAPNGSLEGGSSGWSLSGARVIPQSNTLRRARTRSPCRAAAPRRLRRPASSSLDPASRFFLRSTGASDGQLKVEVTYKSLLGLVHVQLDARVRRGERLLAAQPEVRARAP